MILTLSRLVFLQGLGYEGRKLRRGGRNRQGRHNQKKENSSLARRLLGSVSNLIH